MLPATIIAHLEKLRLTNVRIITFGDFNHLESVCCRWRHKDLPGDVFRGTDLYRKWAGGKQFVLVKCRRSDVAHFEFVSSLLDRAFTTSVKEELRRRYPSRDRYEIHICVSNSKRRELNARCQEEAARRFREEGGRTHPVQSPEGNYEIFPGTPLIGASNRHPTIGKWMLTFGRKHLGWDREAERRELGRGSRGAPGLVVLAGEAQMGDYHPRCSREKPR